jgi:hypothetical protein
MDLALSVGESVTNPVDHDLDLQLGQAYLIDATDALAQRLRIRFRFFLGEWFLNQNEGIPYFRDVFVKNPSRALLTSLFRDVVLNTPGIASVQSFELEMDASARSLSVRFDALTSTGELFSADFGDFIVEVSA